MDADGGAETISQLNRSLSHGEEVVR